MKNIKINSAKEYVFRSQNTFAWLELKIILKSPDKKWWKQFYKAGSMRQGPALITPPPEVDQPTYEVVGEISRIDQRDTVQSRVVLKQGSHEYEDYYSRHPELKAGDRVVLQRL